MTFSTCLKDMSIKKSELAFDMGVSPSTVSRWRESPPKYVWTYLNEKNKVLEAEAKIQQVLVNFDSAFEKWRTENG